MREEYEMLNFRGGNPGAVQYGNFINYYQFNLPKNRLELLPTNIWNVKDQFFGLDVGCNSGDLTVQLLQVLQDTVDNDCRLLAVDIDPTLIHRAKESHCSNIDFQCLDFMERETCEVLFNEYFQKHNISKFSAVFCFSVTMWIHLNHGDDGLKTFLQNICRISEMVIVEPQSWNNYKTAVKRLRQKNEEFPCFKMLQIKENVENEIEDIIINCGMSKVCETSRTKWKRKLLIFKWATQ